MLFLFLIFSNSVDSLFVNIYAGESVTIWVSSSLSYSFKISSKVYNDDDTEDNSDDKM